jgi:hypothetical protein
VYVESAAGDYVGQGKSRLLTSKNAALDLRFIEGFSVKFYQFIAHTGAEIWAGNFNTSQADLRVGYYPGVQRYPYGDLSIGLMELTHQGRGCGRVNGWFAIDDIVYVGQFIAYIEMRFEQWCDLSNSKLRAKIRLSALDFIPAPGPVTPVPAGLWQPAQGSTPPTGDYLFLQSDAGDSIGLGQTRLFTAANANLSGSPYKNSFHIQAAADSTWVGQFTTMNSSAALQTGFYGELGLMPLQDPSKGGQAWLNNERSCNQATGWVAIDEMSLAADGTVTSLEMRFEQRCMGAAGALRGKLRWSAPQTAEAAVTPIPPALWKPPAGAVPTTGNALYLESDYGDPIGLGDTLLFDVNNAVFTFASRGETVIGGRVDNGSDAFNMSFEAPAPLGALRPGFYGNLSSRASSALSAVVSWSGRSTGCDLTGWFAVDSASYSGSQLTAIELRFEAMCNGYGSATRGKLRWSSGDTSVPSGPAATPPGLWQPAAAVIPLSGNYVYLESEYGDDVGNGITDLFTSDTTAITVTQFTTAPKLEFRVGAFGSTDGWEGAISPMWSLTQLEPGFYDGVTRESFRNPAKGGLEVKRYNSFCNRIAGWFVIDSISYSNGLVSAIEFRFEQHCERRSASLRGKVRWASV